MYIVLNKFEISLFIDKNFGKLIRKKTTANLCYAQFTVAHKSLISYVSDP